MAYVKAKPGESFESMWKRFKRSVERAGILSDLKKHEYYEKPSVKRKKKHAAAVKREAKRLKKLEKIRARRPGNQNFKWNKDHTQKIPLKPRPKNFGKSNYKKPYGKKPYNNKSRPQGKPGGYHKKSNHKPKETKQ